jgi:hypothetical protein
MADQKFKSKVKLQGGASLPAETAERVPVIDASGNLVSSAVTQTELGHISGLTSSAQDQITAAQDDATQALTDASNAAQAASDAQADVNDLVTLSGVAANATDLGTFTGSTIPDASTIKAAIQALESELEAIPSPFYYAGVYAASTNTPTLDDTDTGVQGKVYYVTDSGTVDFGAGDQVFNAGDKVANNGSTWDKWDMTDNVASVNSQTGVVVIEADDIDVAAGYTAGAGTVAAADSIQVALQKIDGNAAAAQVDATQALLDAADAQTAIDDHLIDAVGAHAASAIAVTPTGNLAASDVQAALEELQGDIDSAAGASAGDISETSFAVANNQTTVANVTGLVFAAGVVRGFKALVTVEIDATLALFETIELTGINKGGAFEMAQAGVGDESGIVLSITSGGQVQYTSANHAGFVSGAIKFRAETTTV